MQKNKKANSSIDLKVYYEKIDPGAVDFTSGFSWENSIRWVNKLLLGNDRRSNNYDDIQGNDHVYRHHVQD